MKKMLFFASIVLTMKSFGQLSLDDKISRLTTIINSQSNYLNLKSQGSGFFFAELSTTPAIINGQEKLEIKNLWLITNRHVAVMKNQSGKEYLPESFIFNLRKKNNNIIMQVPIEITLFELKKRIKFHVDPNVDIVAVNILDLVLNEMKMDSSIIQFDAVSERDFSEKKEIAIEVCQDVVTIGYPSGYYDLVNVFPIVKSGIIASRWQSKFNGNPYFLIDSKLFPGSSGSLVISKPSNFQNTDLNGTPYYTIEKTFAFLGIYSGEPFQKGPEYDLGEMSISKKQFFNLGIVWYPYLITDIINNGLKAN